MPGFVPFVPFVPCFLEGGSENEEKRSPTEGDPQVRKKPRARGSIFKIHGTWHKCGI